MKFVFSKWRIYFVIWFRNTDLTFWRTEQQPLMRNIMMCYCIRINSSAKKKLQKMFTYAIFRHFHYDYYRFLVFLVFNALQSYMAYMLILILFFFSPYSMHSLTFPLLFIYFFCHHIMLWYYEFIVFYVDAFKSQ